MNKYVSENASSSLDISQQSLLKQSNGIVNELSLIEIIFQTARLHANNIAIVDNGRELTYAQVENLVRALIVELGPDCGTVGVLVTRSANTIIALLAVLAAGGTYCPIDPAYPLERQIALLNASGSRSVIATQKDLVIPEGFRAIQVFDKNLNPEEAISSDQTKNISFTAPDLDSAAYILFTSGSTGTPKGVITSHRAITAAVLSLCDLFQITAADRVMQFAALNWDTCFEEILPALTVGAALIIDAEAYTGSHARLLRMMQTRGVTLVDLPTAFWHELVNYFVEDKAMFPPCVRAVVIGGEAARSARITDWRSLATDAIRLINTYGSTETTLVTHAMDLYGPLAKLPAFWTVENNVPIGKCLSHVVEHIAENGELFIGGPSVAQGYLNLPEQTAERFVILDTGAGAQRYYRTGDGVSRNSGGQLVHQGRLDGELKIRGIRVNPGEVESEIFGHPQVSMAAVVGVKTADHNSLVAYVVPRQESEGATLSEDVLKYLRLRLPKHLVPAKINVVAELAYTSSGKIDRAMTHQRHAMKVN